jgi:hypothetical protein
MSFTIHVAIWTALACCALGMAIYRNLLGIHEPTLHVSGAAAVRLTHEARQFRTEDLIDRWGQRLTMVVLLYGFILADVYLYNLLARGSVMVR